MTPVSRASKVAELMDSVNSATKALPAADRPSAEAKPAANPATASTHPKQANAQDGTEATPANTDPSSLTMTPPAPDAQTLAALKQGADNSNAPHQAISPNTKKSLIDHVSASGSTQANAQANNSAAPTLSAPASTQSPPPPIPTQGNSQQTAANEAQLDRIAGSSMAQNNASAHPAVTENPAANSETLTSTLLQNGGLAGQHPSRASEIVVTGTPARHENLTASAANLNAPGAMQSANSASFSAVHSVAANNMQALVGSPNWNTELGQQVTWMAGNQQQTAVLTLNPPDLGPMRIVLNLSDSQQQLGASFMAAQPETRAAIEAAMPRLREMLDNAGIQLGQTNVSSGGSQSNEWTAGNRDTSHNAPRSAFFGNDDSNALETSSQPPVNIQRTGVGLIDTHA